MLVVYFCKQQNKLTYYKLFLKYKMFVFNILYYFLINLLNNFIDLYASLTLFLKILNLFLKSFF